jgi:molybdopterin molybdotransferase
MISFLAAQHILRRHFKQGAVRFRSLSECLGAVCARDIKAREDDPGFDKAAMDGFAVRARDTIAPGKNFSVQGSIFVAEAPFRLAPGACCRIATGAALPLGADAVVKKEDARVGEDGRSVILKNVARGEHVLRRGSHFKKGAIMLRCGYPVRGAGVALAASQGLMFLPVVRPPTVALLSTGDEVASPGGLKKQFGVRNATGPMLGALIKACGGDPVFLGTCRDDEKSILPRIRQGLKADILIVTGAVSVGERDLVPALLEKAGVKILFHGVRIKPGKPVLFGKRGRTLCFGVPGNPVATLVTFALFARPAIERWQGRSGRLTLETGVCRRDYSLRADRLSFVPARLGFQAGVWQVDPLRLGDSADMRTAAQADGFFIYEENRKMIKRGVTVSFFKI